MASPFNSYTKQSTASKPETLSEKDVQFVEPLPNDLECPVCICFLKDPTLTSCCGHHFCKECINRVIRRNHVCPVCKVKGFLMFINKEKQRVINSLKVCCTKKPKGCQWIGELRNLEYHLSREGDCEYVEVECEFGPMGCAVTIMRRDLLKHNETCTSEHLSLMMRRTLRPQTCESNDQQIEKMRVEIKHLTDANSQMKTSLKQQDEAIVVLSESIQAKEKEINHMQSRLVEMECKMSDKVKQVSCLQSDMLEVKAKCTQKDRQYDEFLAKLFTLEDTIEGSNSKSAPIIQQPITRAVSPTPEVYIPVNFTMKDFASYKAHSTDWYSTPFYTNRYGYKLCLRVVANGSGTSHGKYISAYFHILLGKYDDHQIWPLNAAICLKVLNPNGTDDDIETSIQFSESLSRLASKQVVSGEWNECGMGGTKLMRHSKIPVYVFNDAITFRVASFTLD